MTVRHVALKFALALGAVLAMSAPAAAFHIPAAYDCGAAGTLMSEGPALPTGEEAPQGYVAILEGTTGVLVALEVYASGELLYTTPGRYTNSFEEVTCTATVGGVHFTIVGILTK